MAHCDDTRPDDHNAPAVADCTQPMHLITLFADGHGTFLCGNVWVMALFNPKPLQNNHDLVSWLAAVGPRLA